MNQTFIEYVKAQGVMPRKPFALLWLMLFVFVVTSQMYFIQQTKAMGLTVETPQDIIVPVPGALAVLLAFAAMVPAVIMRARDAGWPAWAFGSIYGAHVGFMALHRLFDITVLPPAAGFVWQGITLVAIIALLLKPSAPHEDEINEENNT